MTAGTAFDPRSRALLGSHSACPVRVRMRVRGRYGKSARKRPSRAKAEALRRIEAFSPYA
jgi:hypothetical protein